MLSALIASIPSITQEMLEETNRQLLVQVSLICERHRQEIEGTSDAERISTRRNDEERDSLDLGRALRNHFDIDISFRQRPGIASERVSSESIVARRKTRDGRRQGDEELT